MRAISLWLLAAVLALPATAAEDAWEAAVSAELARASELKSEGYQAPYYTGLTATDVSQRNFRCSMGGGLGEVVTNSRIVTPVVRVGSHEIDNRPVSGAPASSGRAVALEGDVFALRHSLWRLLDGAYKSASAAYLRKQALRVTRGKTEYDTDDWSRESPRVLTAGQPPAPWSAEELRELCRRASAAFRRAPGLLQADVEISLNRQWSRLRDSEGTKADFGRDIAEVDMQAVDITTDGMKIRSSRRVLETSSMSWVTAGTLEDSAAAMLSELAALKVAQSTSPFSAPALLDPSAAAAVVLALGLRLTGEEQRNPSGAQIFRDKMGRLVLPETLSLRDDPTVVQFRGQSLAGHYRLDDQGIPAAPVDLIEKGVLKSFLLSRYPVIGFPRSNGHGRSNPGVEPAGMPGNLFLNSSKTYPASGLLSRLRAECLRLGKTHGLWIKSLRQFTQKSTTGGQDSIRLIGMVSLVEARTGRVTLTRDLDIVGTPLVLMSRILASGSDPRVRNFSAGGVPVSVVTSSLLVAEAELQRSESKPEKAPILSPPSVP